MALNVDKLKQTNTVSTPVSTSTDTSTRTNKSLSILIIKMVRILRLIMIF